MVNQSGWNEGNKPSRDGIYLVRITLEDSRELGFGDHPPILVASYKKKEHSCALFTGANNVVVTGRSMDWKEDMYSNLWVMPRG